MRSLLSSLASLSLLVVPAQTPWTRLMPNVPPPDAPVMGFGTSYLMTGPGEGFALQTIHYSPSSGYGFTMFHTADDWNDAPLRVFGPTGGGGSNCCDYWMVEEGPDGGVFIRWSENIYYRTAYAAYHEGSMSYYPLGAWGPYSIHYTIADGQRSYGAGPFPGIDSVLYVLKGSPSGWNFIDTLVLPGTNVKSMAFRGRERGCMVVDIPLGGMLVLVSLDSGYTWQTSLETELWIRDIEWSDDSNIWLAGNGSMLLHSVDAGETWQEVDLPEGAAPWSMDSYSNDSLWLVGSGGTVLTTGNAGLEWVELPLDTSIDLRRVQAFPGVVYVYSSTGAIYRYPPLPDPDHEQERDDWWCFNPGGILLLPGSDEHITGLNVHDLNGRPIQVRRSGEHVDLRSLPAGVYVLEMHSDQRSERGKVLWLSTDP